MSRVYFTAFLTAGSVVDSVKEDHNEQFFQVGLLDRALISLGLALSPPSTSVSSDFMVLCTCSLKIITTSVYLVEGLVW